MAKNWFDINNVITTFKGIGVSLITGLTLLVPAIFGMWLVNRDLLMAGRLIQIGTAIMYFPTWGYYADKFWHWK